MLKLDPSFDLKRELLRAVIEALQNTFERAINDAVRKIGDVVYTALTTAPEYNAMLPGGELYGEIGNPDIEKDLNIIINTLINNIGLDATIKPLTENGNEISGYLELDLLGGGYDKILSLREAWFITEKGVPLPWLDWMLLGRNTVMIRGWHFVDTAHDTSRTGFGWMKWGGDFTLSNYAGTEDDNWITRSLTTIQDTLEKSIESEFSKTFG